MTTKPFPGTFGSYEKEGLCFCYTSFPELDNPILPKNNKEGCHACSSNTVFVLSPAVVLLSRYARYNPDTE
ncbi:hypothetical protein NSMM_80013 [Nitrosomonas mobilis]|uniref:Uncharacterized protein n=1 Tax=Nitrosomonas mobilis TaxID=51642 RepID=A0A1G5SHV0_9PROT|nr:hypothetical protein NSMM_80013 [Nitrosomonas mobilis]